MELCELLPDLAEVADDICLVRSMHTGVNNHGQSINALNTGRITAGRPSLGSWLTYAPRDRERGPARLLRADRSRRAAGPRRRQLVERLAAVALPGHGGPPARAAHPQPRPAAPRSRARRRSGTSTTSTGSTASTSPSTRASTTWRPGSPATSWPPGCRPPPRRRSTSRARPTPPAEALRPRRPRDARVRHALPDRPPAGRARRAVRAGLHRQPGLGPSRRDRQVTAQGVPARSTSPPRPWSAT